jgi:hypothetical protein
MRISLSFKWFDLWVGAYWDAVGRILYVCPLPTICLRIDYMRSYGQGRCRCGNWTYHPMLPEERRGALAGFAGYWVSAHTACPGPTCEKCGQHLHPDGTKTRS